MNEGMAASKQSGRGLKASVQNLIVIDSTLSLPPRAFTSTKLILQLSLISRYDVERMECTDVANEGKAQLHEGDDGVG